MSEKRRLEAVLRNKRDILDGLCDRIKITQQRIIDLDAEKARLQKAMDSGSDPRAILEAQQEGPKLERQKKELKEAIRGDERDIGRVENEIRGLGVRTAASAPGHLGGENSDGSLEFQAAFGSRAWLM